VEPGARQKRFIQQTGKADKDDEYKWLLDQASLVETFKRVGET
jgi:hypothetical protein